MRRLAAMLAISWRAGVRTAASLFVLAPVRSVGSGEVGKNKSKQFISTPLHFRYGSTLSLGPRCDCASAAPTGGSGRVRVTSFGSREIKGMGCELERRKQGLSFGHLQARR